MIDTLSNGQQLVVDGDDGDNKLAHVGHICFLVQFLEFSGNSAVLTETAADRGHIPLAPTMHAITEARTHGILWLYKSQRKATSTAGGKHRTERTKRGDKNRNTKNEQKNPGKTETSKRRKNQGVRYREKHRETEEENKEERERQTLQRGRDRHGDRKKDEGMKKKKKTKQRRASDSTSNLTSSSPSS
ncbi:hypothetical protein NC651_005460 [Populus alba x Populus x berolinensis]|nr:hypothetical protein NC651_005460 [Populus alba x Populus x berolinensis]